MTRILLLLLKFYQYFISPLLGNNCRFHPTCSEYAKEAITTHGALKGLWLTFKRIIKCQPFYNGALLRGYTNRHCEERSDVAIQKNNKNVID
ncbi:membrane protein insertion efficiency factor YidD [Rickettsia endosymbiont of Cantharis rufa]|uniref:membrane protein insertion efficiency factor YidD n=1 Tax=Rickettsia endosymbiont of Cantharis rufa TaxID=3066248 RepID=UPI003132DE9A